MRRPGDTDFLPGELVERQVFEEVNREVVENGGEPAQADVLLGILKGALSTDSFLAAASRRPPECWPMRRYAGPWTNSVA